MAFVKLVLIPAWKSYTCTEASNMKMEILGNLLSRDVECNADSYKQTLADNSLRAQCGNFTCMAKENDYVLLSNLYSEKAVPTEFKIPQAFFIQLLNDWLEKVCAPMPKIVIITYDDKRFTVETSDITDVKDKQA